ncbi:hypothetical protein Leryth_011267 [Lithospermum erythrorhizon]|nr:hypothetical protein Leryth_011267 [Lithospermum erythrorhizon]
MKLIKLGFIIALASGVSALFIYLVGVSSSPNWTIQLTYQDIEALQSLQSNFQKCVSANGLGLQATNGNDYCKVTVNFPSDTEKNWIDPKTGEHEPLSYEFDLCEAVATWEQVRNSTTILTREFIEALPNGWEEYAWRRINKGILLNRCKNRTLCMEKLSHVLPDRPPYVPRQFSRCAVVGNSGDLLKIRFGQEIDKYDAVIRENGAPIEVYHKTTIHDIMNQMIREVPILNPVFLMLGTSFGSSAKGTGLKALEFALSLCDSVDMYGFTVDPGYQEWTRYFSEPRKGHTPLLGRAYYQMMECLGLVKIHSPMRADPNREIKRVGARVNDPLGPCSIIKKQLEASPTRKSSLRKAAVSHQEYVNGTTMYPLEHQPGHGLLCTVPLHSTIKLKSDS